jgi:hypothetical protein
MRSGLVLALAPSGPRVRLARSLRGIQSLTIPRIGEATAHLLSRFDAYVAGAVWEGRVNLGRLTTFGPRRGTKRDNGQRFAVDAVANAMIEVTQSATGLPVHYNPSEG